MAEQYRTLEEWRRVYKEKEILHEIIWQELGTLNMVKCASSMELGMKR